MPEQPSGRKLSLQVPASQPANDKLLAQRRKYSQNPRDLLPELAEEGGSGEGINVQTADVPERERSKSKWRLPFFRKSRKDRKASVQEPSTVPSGDTGRPDTEFQSVCPPLAEGSNAKAIDPRQETMRVSFDSFFNRSKTSEGPSEASSALEAPSKENVDWVSPSSWAIMERHTYSSSLRGNRLSVDMTASIPESLWAVRVFKPLDVSDGVMSNLIASSGHTYVTITCELETTAAEICQLLLRKFTSQRDLSRFRLYVVHRNTERLLAHGDQPIMMFRDYLMTVGYMESDQLTKIAREDHSYICRFIFREYPPAPPRSEDFIEGLLPSGKGAGRAGSGSSKARITARSAYLADVNVAVVPTPIFVNAESLEFIDLSRNTLLNLPDDLFETLTNLRLLRLTGNLLSKVPEALLVCPSITHLDLSSNFLDGLALTPLAEMPRLTHLNVSCNRIRSLPETFGELKTLRCLDISSNYLEELPECIWELSDLRELNASFNSIHYVPGEIVNLKYLRSLVLVGNSITQISSEMSELQHLRQLDIRGNLLLTLNGTEHVTSLFEVSLDYNHLTEIKEPSWPHLVSLSCISNTLTGITLTDRLANLKRLDLSCSQLVTLPDEIFSFMTALDTLNLQQNELIKLPRTINLLTSLERLVAHSNSLSEVSLNFSSLSQLSYLDIHTNNITTINGDIWNAPSLKILNISSNFLSKFPPPPISMEPLALTKCMEELLAAENRLEDDIVDSIVMLKELRVLNLSYNMIFDLGDSLRSMSKLVEVYLSGNGLTSFPEEIDKLHSLRMLFINNNKITNLPAELGKNAHLAVFDVQSNSLKYNISNWPYDWNWNFNIDLQYLNLANNRKLEITTNPGHHAHSPLERTLNDFKSMHKLRLIDVTNVQVSPACLPETVASLQVRTTEDQSGLRIAIVEYCGRAITFDHAELISRRFMGQEKDHLVGLFDGCGHDFVSSYLRDSLEENLKLELRRLKAGEDFTSALRRAFLATNRDLSLQPVDLRKGSTAVLLYLLENQLFVANVGDTMAVMSREGKALVLTTKHHAWSRSEQRRIRDLGGFISLQGLVERELPITRAFGYHHLLPFVNSNPALKDTVLGPTDEFVLIATQSFWRVMSYQMAVDVARASRHDPDLAVQKLRDMAISHGVSESMKIIFLDFRGITTQGPVDTTITDRRRTAFKRQAVNDQVLSRLDEESTPPKPPCAFVFTDIKDSTRLWSMLPNAMRTAIRMHNQIMRRLMRTYNGYEVKTEGDAFVVAFQSGVNAVKWCLAIQQEFLEAEWPREILESPIASPVYGADGALLYRGLSIRMGIHYGMADDEEDKVAHRMDYLGVNMIIASRVSALANGGQIFISDVVRDLFISFTAAERPETVEYDLGMIPLKGLEEPTRIYVLYPTALAERHRIRSDSLSSTVSGGEEQVAAVTSQMASTMVSDEDTQDNIDERTGNVAPLRRSDLFPISEAEDMTEESGEHANRNSSSSSPLDTTGTKDKTTENVNQQDLKPVSEEMK